MSFDNYSSCLFACTLFFCMLCFYYFQDHLKLVVPSPRDISIVDIPRTIPLLFSFTCYLFV